ncbi:MAG: hypothetical protein H6700_02635 [Myxococcales bacterium]|nr:hypothetical protein [Myxococcales bacterium]MCB9519633.1 hypothetical protein [Myxococcales bacterium]MCB9530636.1 hypothetical protein [Myxococcales bacterium]
MFKRQLVQPAALLAALLSASCGGDAAPDGSDAAQADASDAGADAAPDGSADSDAQTDADAAPSEVTLRTWCRESTQLMCDWMYRCFGEADLARAEELFQMTAATCAPNFDVSCQTRTMVSVSEGRQTYSAEDAAVCLAALQNVECDTLDNMSTALGLDVCVPVTLGLVERGGACTNTPDCVADGSRCANEVCTGTLERSAFQVACADGAECSGLVCLAVSANEQGYAGICSAPCRADGDCGTGGVCVTDAAGEHVCLASCETADDCDNGLGCVTSGESSACYVTPLAEP